MFTGIVTDIGVLRKRDGGRFQIASSYPAASIEEGASIACDGCCLTVTSAVPGEGGKGSLFAVEASNETLDLTALSAWSEGRRINLERAMKLGDELGGHIVSGHVDGTAELLERRQDGSSVRFFFRVPAKLARYIAPKGSIALNGVSLTVNEVEADVFGVNLIPYTLEHTGFRDLKQGDLVNLEVDMLARYVERLTLGGREDWSAATPAPADSKAAGQR
jgi:riboflavin synthase